MHKLPVMDTVGRAFSFLGSEFGTIIRVSWLLFLLTAIVQYVASWATIASMRSSSDLDTAMLAAHEASNSGGSFIVLLISMVTTAIVAVALHRVILFGERRPGSLAYIAFGKVELLFIVLSVLGLIATIALIAVGALALVPLASLIGNGGIALVICGLVALVVFVFVRISLVLPLAVVTRRFRFGESWRLTKGNFWRLLAVWILVALPILIVGMAVMAVVVPMAIGSFQLNTTDPHAQIEAFAAFMSAVTLVQIVVTFLVSIFGGALGVAVLSYSYKALSGHGADEILTPQAGT